MRNKGMLFTLSAILLGGTLFAFSMTQNHLSKTYAASSSILALEKVASQSANVEYNIQKTYKRVLGVGFDQTGDELTINGTLPVSLAQYGLEMDHLRYFVNATLPQTTFTQNVPEVTSSHNITFKHTSDIEAEFYLPPNTDQITFDAEFMGLINESQCNRSLTPGSVDISLNFKGQSPDDCNTPSGWKSNISDTGTYIKMNQDKIKLTIDNNVLRLENDEPHQLNFTISIRVNESVVVRPLTLKGNVQTTIGQTTKSGVIRIQ